MAEQKNSIWTYVFTFVALIVAFKACDACLCSPSKNSPPLDSREAKIKSQFSSWDGSHIKLEKWVKDKMNDPGSYEHVETTYLDNGDNLTIIMTFRGKNAFGGVVKNLARAEVDLEGNFIGIPTIQ